MSILSPDSKPTFMNMTTATASVENNVSKQVWTAPTLTTLSLPLGTLSNAASGADANDTMNTNNSLS